MSFIVLDSGKVTVLPTTARVMAVHEPNECSGRECVIHAPTDHAMCTWPLHWRGDRGMFERLCPHGIGHPDPDQRAYWREQAERGEVNDEVETDDGYDLAARTPDDHVSAMSVHGCDGCCS